MKEIQMIEPAADLDQLQVSVDSQRLYFVLQQGFKGHCNFARSPAPEGWAPQIFTVPRALRHSRLIGRRDQFGYRNTSTPMTAWVYSHCFLGTRLISLPENKQHYWNRLVRPARHREDC